MFLCFDDREKPIFIGIDVLNKSIFGVYTHYDVDLLPTVKREWIPFPKWHEKIENSLSNKRQRISSSNVQWK